MPRRGKQPIAVDGRESPVGSGMSAEALAKDIAAQPALFQAAATSLRSIGKRPAVVRKEGRTHAIFDLSKIGTASAHKKHVDDYAVFELYPCKYIKGPLKDQLSSNINLKAKPLYGQNAAFKAIIAKHAKGQYAKWNDEIKAYGNRVKTAVIARNILAEMRKLGGGIETMLPGTIDESIFDNAKLPEVSIFPYENTIAVHGDTFEFKDDLVARGFVYDKDAKIFTHPTMTIEDPEVDELDEEFVAFGWEVNIFSEAQVI